MKTYNYLFITTMTLGVMFLTSCSKESVSELPTSTNNPTTTPWEGSTGAVYQIELDLDTDLTIEKPDCTVDNLPKDNESNSPDHVCDHTYTAFGSVKGFSNTLGESNGSIMLTFDQEEGTVSGQIALTHPNTSEELVLGVQGQVSDNTLTVGSIQSFVGLNFSGDIVIDNILDVFQSDSKVKTSMMVVGELK